MDTGMGSCVAILCRVALFALGVAAMGACSVETREDGDPADGAGLEDAAADGVAEPDTSVDADIRDDGLVERDWAAQRDTLLRLLWEDGRLPTAPPTTVEREIESPIYPGLAGVTSVDRLTFSTAYDLYSVIDLYHAEAPNGRLAVYHEGHGHNVTSPLATEMLLGLGYSVLVINMPMFGPNVDPDFSTTGRRHCELEPLEAEDPRLMHVFLSPVAMAIHYALETHGYDDEHVVMVGLSGGGWTTTLYAALDPRISASFPVAGSLPHDLRGAADVGEFEQLEERPFYRGATFPELYALGTTGGRTQIQALNYDDTCCFKVRGRVREIREYEAEVAEAAEANGGWFEVFVSRVHDGHQVSAETRDRIAEELADPG
jgi:pimeloyl-ACP methyl ester carboxylesterase